MNVVNKTCEASPQPLLRGRGLSEGHSILTTQEFESDQYFDYERYELRFQPAEGVVVVEGKGRDRLRTEFVPRDHVTRKMPVTRPFTPVSTPYRRPSAV